MASEQRSERSRSHARWQRAFESDPYEPEIRAGLVRTSVDLARLPALNDSCLATLYLRGMRWEQAAELFAALAERDNRRTDYQIGQLLALWQLGLNEQAYELAGRLTQTQPYLLYAWIVTDATGDANDQALARHPLTTMDPDGDYLRLSTGLAAPDRQVRLNLTEADKEVLERVLPEAESLQADD